MGKKESWPPASRADISRRLGFFFGAQCQRFCQVPGLWRKEPGSQGPLGSFPNFYVFLADFRPLLTCHFLYTSVGQVPGFFLSLSRLFKLGW